MGTSPAATSSSTHDATARRAARAALLAPAFSAAFASGVWLGLLPQRPFAWPWLVAGLAAVLVSIIARRQPRRRLAALAIALLAVGASWTSLRASFIAADDLAARRDAGIGAEPSIVRVRGTALDGPEVRRPAGGSMSRFDFRPGATTFRLRVEALLSRHGDESPARGTVVVRVAETVAPFQAGDSITTAGFLSAPTTPQNPGAFDFASAARARGEAGILHVASRSLMQVTARNSSSGAAIRAWRERVRRRAGAWLLSDLPATGRAGRDALLAALLLGRREGEMAALIGSFQRVGLAHLLAISGLHLGVLAGFALLLLRWHGHPRPWHGLAIAALVVAYLIVVEARLPVLRAGFMAIAAGLGLASRRRIPVSSLIALAGLGLLAWRPEQITRPGFQLSFGVVLGLIHLSPAVRRRWFGVPRSTVASSAEMLGQWLASAVSVAVVAWAIATPITIFHFGMFSPWAVPLSVVALPVVALLLALGFAKIACAALLPSAALLIGAILAVGADLLISIVTAVDSLPGSVVYTPRPPAAWSLTALAIVWWWGAARADRLPSAGRRLGVCSRLAALAALLGWLSWPALAARASPSLRVDMLAVGNGSCILVRSRGRAAIFDAGSSTDLDAGRRTIVPALRSLGVGAIEFMAISHGNLDHFSAVLEVVDAFDIRRVLVTPQLISRAGEEPMGPGAFLLLELNRRDVVIGTSARGDSQSLGESRWQWVHPAESDRFGHVNDASMVVMIDAGAAGARRRVLLTGDIQAEAIDTVMRREPGLEADVLELPHHGSFTPSALAFVLAVDPDVVLQSTGRRRWRHDGWSGLLPGIERFVTARDGACRVEVTARGELRAGRWNESGRAVSRRRPDPRSPSSPPR